MPGSSSNPLDPRPTVIVYGNCQSDAATSILNRHPAFAERYRAIFYPGYDHPTQRAEDISAQDFAACALLLEQRDQIGFAGRHLLPDEVRVVKFPALDFNLFWPFNTVNPFNTASPENPHGFPYGDRIVVGCVKKGMSADAILEYYLEGWDEYGVDLNRLAALETARIALRDSHSDVQFGSLVLERFRDKRLFWTANHPTADLLGEMTSLLLAAAFPGEVWASNSDTYETIVTNFSDRGPLGAVGVPIHPQVAAYLGLDWYRFDEPYQTGDGRFVSYREYFAEMIAVSVERFQADGGAAEPKPA